MQLVSLAALLPFLARYIDDEKQEHHVLLYIDHGNEEVLFQADQPVPDGLKQMILTRLNKKSMVQIPTIPKSVTDQIEQIQTGQFVRKSEFFSFDGAELPKESS